ncbi:tetraacyldisaccharide 4'-kinase [Pseudodesulfovibrio sp.]|uniref:tetraacyldisaccharide 4'-kinase n=1 Tax=unclassified Pseudodesulfovibrio TaxID=2661612 RepID=UPI003AFFBFEB
MSDRVSSLQDSFSWLLTPISWCYAGIMRFRAMMYRNRLLPVWEPEVLTVSVGNIGWGGSGKTPLAGWLLEWAIAKGLEPMLLTRGYKAKPVVYPYLVKKGALPEEAGDEPLMLARAYPEARIIVDPVRRRSGRLGIRRYNPGLIVLDDGFQHMAVHRHVNLVLLRPEDLTEQWDRVIPRGSWREPKKALERADAFLIKTGPKGFEQLRPHIDKLLVRFRKPVFSFQVVPVGVANVLTGESRENFTEGRYILVSGTGDPRAIMQSARHLTGSTPAKHLIYPDHHAYAKSDVLDMQATAKRLECEFILCTPKDAVKLGPMCTPEFWQFELRMAFGPSTIGAKTPFNIWWKGRYESEYLRRVAPGKRKESNG